MAKLDIIIGPMYAGKSTELIRRIRQLKTLNKKYIVIKPSIDTRYSNNFIVSHNQDKENCINVENLNDFIVSEHLKNINTIFIDEAQFFKDLKKNVLQLVEHYNINVVVVGLDGDFNRNKFGEILDLIPYSDSCQKITALCKECNDGTPACFTYRINDSDNQVQVGNDYISLCRHHYLHYS